VADYMVQFIDTAKSDVEAAEILGFLKTQVDFVAGRILEPPGNGEWRVQAFFEDCGHSLPLPGGCLRVIIIPSFLQQMRTWQ
jgi:hypothetical protein